MTHDHLRCRRRYDILRVALVSLLLGITAPSPGHLRRFRRQIRTTPRAATRAERRGAGHLSGTRIHEGSESDNGNYEIPSLLEEARPDLTATAPGFKQYAL